MLPTQQTFTHILHKQFLQAGVLFQECDNRGEPSVSDPVRIQADLLYAIFATSIRGQKLKQECTSIICEAVVA